jgi:hypothetical protein
LSKGIEETRKKGERRMNFKEKNENNGGGGRGGCGLAVRQEKVLFSERRTKLFSPHI